jgi:hypothetical protein
MPTRLRLQFSSASRLLARLWLSGEGSQKRIEPLLVKALVDPDQCNGYAAGMLGWRRKPKAQATVLYAIVYPLKNATAMPFKVRCDVS